MLRSLSSFLSDLWAYSAAVLHTWEYFAGSLAVWVFFTFGLEALKVLKPLSDKWQHRIDIALVVLWVALLVFSPFPVWRSHRGQIVTAQRSAESWRRAELLSESKSLTAERALENARSSLSHLDHVPKLMVAAHFATRQDSLLIETSGAPLIEPLLSNAT